MAAKPKHDFEPTKGNERARISLDVDAASKANFETVRAKTGISTLTELIKKSVSFFGLATDHQAKGGAVIFRHKDGKEDRVLFL